MNRAMIRNILGSVLEIEAALLLIPVLTALWYRENVGWFYLGTALLCFLTGYLFRVRKAKDTVFYLKEGCVITGLSWVLMSAFGCLPLFASSEIPRFEDALFETISGFTTTGASIVPAVEELSHTALMWRSLTHWIGGMGVLVFLLAIMPSSGSSHMNIMRAESPGPSVGKLVPKVRATAKILYRIYFGMTVLEIVLLLFGGMTFFEALNTSLATAGTGGFGIKNDSLLSFSPYIQWVVAIFMILFGINFNVFYLLLFGQVKKALKCEELRAYLALICGAVVIVFFNIIHMIGNAADALRHSVFTVGSLISSTGFATLDFDTWPATSRTILVMCMFVGACAGSTGGGIKVSRMVIAIKTVFKELNSYIHPKSVRKIRFEDKPVEHEVVRAVNVYLITFFIIFTASILLVSLEGKDLVTNFAAVIATMNNIGPGLEMVGPTKNFAHFNVLSKFVLMFDMLAGRLELFPMLLLFHPGIIKAFFRKSNVKESQ
ncbi:MAG: TrkH family potassium uptake protein [Lachnospiraceae bacterium]|nr:TrkH family potassium uptake protein [Lachnospiraceae bacterium]